MTRSMERKEHSDEGANTGISSHLALLRNSSLLIEFSCNLLMCILYHYALERQGHRQGGVLT